MRSGSLKGARISYRQMRRARRSMTKSWERWIDRRWPMEDWTCAMLISTVTGFCSKRGLRNAYRVCSTVIAANFRRLRRQKRRPSLRALLSITLKPIARLAAGLPGVSRKGNAMLDRLGLVARAINFLSFVKAARWIAPSKSPEDADCAVMEFDLELSPETVEMMGIVTAILRKFDPRVDTDHPVFRYLGQQQVAGQPSEITLTLAIKPTEGAEHDRG